MTLVADVIALGNVVIAFAVAAGIVVAALILAAVGIEARRHVDPLVADLIRLDELDRWHTRASRWKLTITSAGQPILGPLSLTNLETLLTYAGHDEGSLLYPLVAITPNPSTPPGFGRWLESTIDPPVGIDVRYELADAEPWIHDSDTRGREAWSEYAAQRAERELPPVTIPSGNVELAGEVVWTGPVSELWQAVSRGILDPTDDVLVTRPRSTRS